MHALAITTCIYRLYITHTHRELPRCITFVAIRVKCLLTPPFHHLGEDRPLYRMTCHSLIRNRHIYRISNIVVNSL